MLDYLVTSKARRRLLTLLWKESAVGSVSALAERANVAFASAYRELHTMKLLGLVTSAREEGAEVFRANDESPWTPLMRALVASPPPVRSAVEDAQATKTRGELRSLGGPLFDRPVAVTDYEAALVRGVALSHQDPTVARVLPLCFRRAAEDRDLDLDRLLTLARDAGEKQGVGFFLDLTASLSGDMRFKRWAASFRDRRYARAHRSFFPELSPASREAAAQNTPPLAKAWGLRMNMGLDAFKSMYEKHAGA